MKSSLPLWSSVDEAYAINEFADIEVALESYATLT